MAHAELETKNELLGPMEDDDEGARANKHLLFNIGKESYGLNIADITQIIEMQRITDVPDMAGYMKGVINLRGKIIPVMDLRLRFGIDERAYDDRNCVIVVNIDSSIIGLIVDSVAEVHDIRQSDIEPPPELGTTEERGNYICGFGKMGEKVTIIINAQEILHTKELENINSTVQEV